ncbi:MAG: hypothetical protein HQK53_02120 [Oligoflexia bacterium]|nr:hypothetical protein [Oligoflexia bacterium]
MSSQDICIHLSQSVDPYWNLALEEQLFTSFDPLKQHLLLLWRNSPSVIIGRYQNPHLECDLVKMQEWGIPLVRRISGGGCVYHDLGNFNFSFMVAKNKFNKDSNFDFLLSFIRTQLPEGVAVPTRSSRDDLLLLERKFSGSAYKMLRDKVLHHGTILIAADIERLSDLLFLKRMNDHSENKTDRRGTRSQRSPVINLVELNPDLSYEQLQEAFCQHYMQYHQCRHREEIILVDEQELHRRATFFRSWQWCHGETPL